ncbi:hypothetical protein GVAV_002647 [Gurleya vavrai]
MVERSNINNTSKYYNFSDVNHDDATNMIDCYNSDKKRKNSKITVIFMLKLIAFDFLNYIQSEMLNSMLEKKQPNSNNLKYLDKYEYCKTDFSLDNLQANHKKCFVFSIDFAQYGIKNMLNYLK